MKRTKYKKPELRSELYNQNPGRPTHPFFAGAWEDRGDSVTRKQLSIAGKYNHTMPSIKGERLA